MNLNLLFDMCRWQVEEEDVGGEWGSERMPPTFDQQAFIEAIYHCDCYHCVGECCGYHYCTG